MIRVFWGQNPEKWRSMKILSVIFFQSLFITPNPEKTNLLQINKLKINGLALIASTLEKYDRRAGFARILLLNCFTSSRSLCYGAHMVYTSRPPVDHEA